MLCISRMYIMSFALFLCAAVSSAQDCSQFNGSSSTLIAPPIANMTDGTGHTVTNGHGVLGYVSTSCSYSGAAGNACSVSCSAALTNAGPFEQSSTVSNILLQHAISWSPFSGSGTANAGGSVTCAAGAGVAVNSCAILTDCTATISVSAGANGLGASFSFPPNPIWINSFSSSNSCAARTAPVCRAPGPPPYVSPSIGVFVWSTNSCSWVLQPCQGYGCFGFSPIIIDTDGSGFHLTSAAGGVLFDFFGNGHPIQISWTAPTSTNGWLALDRNHNGLIDSAQELFGDITAQPTSPTPNGFLALAVFDTPAQGGNGDGVIDKNDAIWSQLLVWIDSNHDGISQASELHHVDDIGIHSISLKYVNSPFTDAFGNRFRYKGSLNPVKSDPVDRTIFDVFLTIK